VRTATSNTFAEIVAGWVSAGFSRGPTFRRERRQDGEFRAFVKAPAGSTVGHLVVLTDKGNLWVRFAPAGLQRRCPPHLFYGVESRAEMLSIIRALLTERIVFVVTYRGNEWRGTTLMARRDAPPRPRRGETVNVVSWSGRSDRVIEATYARRT